MCEKKGSKYLSVSLSLRFCLGFILCDNEPATDGCSGSCLGLGHRNNCHSKDAKERRRRVKYQRRFYEREGEDSGEDQLECDLQEKVLELTGRTLAALNSSKKKLKNKTLLLSFHLAPAERVSVQLYLLKVCTVQQWLQWFPTFKHSIVYL